MGLLTFLDPPRPDTKKTIEDAKSYGVAVKMITGDHLLIAKETARVLEMGDNIRSSNGLPMLDPVTKLKPENLGRDYGDMCLAADGFSQVFPEHKYLIVECLRELGYKVGMTGDGKYSHSTVPHFLISFSQFTFICSPHFHISLTFSLQQISLSHIVRCQ